MGRGGGAVILPILLPTINWHGWGCREEWRGACPLPSEFLNSAHLRPQSSLWNQDEATLQLRLSPYWASFLSCLESLSLSLTLLWKHAFNNSFAQESPFQPLTLEKNTCLVFVLFLFFFWIHACSEPCPNFGPRSSQRLSWNQLLHLPVDPLCRPLYTSGAVHGPGETRYHTILPSLFLLMLLHLFPRSPSTSHYKKPFLLVNYFLQSCLPARFHPLGYPLCMVYSFDLPNNPFQLLVLTFLFHQWGSQKQFIAKLTKLKLTCLSPFKLLQFCYQFSYSSAYKGFPTSKCSRLHKT